MATCECHLHVCITTSLVVSHVRIGFSHKKKKITLIKITDLRGSDYEALTQTVGHGTDTSTLVMI